MSSPLMSYLKVKAFVLVPGSRTDDPTKGGIIDVDDEVPARGKIAYKCEETLMSYDKLLIKVDQGFLLITGEKATEEAIENLLSCDEHEGILYEAMQKHGRGAVLDAITEIEERRDAMKEARKNLMNLHQILLGIASPVEGPGGVGGGGLPSPVESHVSPAPNPLTAIFARKVGVGKLNDYEKETRNQAYIALAIALICSIIIITVYLYRENAENNELLPPAQ